MACARPNIDLRRRFSVNPALIDLEAIVQQHQVREVPGSDGTEFMVDTEESGRVAARHLHGFRKADAEHLNRVANRCGHVEVGSGERSVFAGALASRDLDWLSVEDEGLIPTNARHCVGH